MTNLKSLFVAICMACVMLSSISVAFLHGAKPLHRTNLQMAFIAPPHVQLLLPISQPPAFDHGSLVGVGIKEFNAGNSQMLSLQERRPPTKEEIEEKKRNFNLWFWGGGFVAPFLATFYYFGFKFWER